MPDTAPYIQKVQGTVPAAAAAAAQDEVIGKAPFAGEVSRATIIPEAALTADAANNRTFRLVNKGQAGTGTTVIASYQSNVGGGNLVAFDEKELTLQGAQGSATRQVAEGDVLALDEVVAGTGVAHSGYEAVVEISRGGV